MKSLASFVVCLLFAVPCFANSGGASTGSGLVLPAGPASNPVPRSAGITIVNPGPICGTPACYCTGSCQVEDSVPGSFYCTEYDAGGNAVAECEWPAGGDCDCHSLPK